ncbi:MAG: hypothetical protein NT076_03425 [Candidatus Pacearchaeota archaeon]|nr:hypothetical protein [Candidatus Pacearchaeota archaeon]
MYEEPKQIRKRTIGALAVLIGLAIFAKWNMPPYSPQEKPKQGSAIIRQLNPWYNPMDEYWRVRDLNSRQR